MSVASTIRPVILPFFPPGDKRLPQGIWHSRGTLAGDASGGLAQQTHQWTVARTSQMFSVEGITVQVTGQAANPTVTYEIATQMVTSGGIQFIQYGNFATEFAVAAQDSNGAGVNVGDSVPIFVPETATAWSILLTVPNPGAAQNFIASCWGYLWELAALQQMGGPIRPKGGALLFS